MASLVKAFKGAYPPAPTFTEKNLPDLLGKVYIVTGANTGVGKELAQILYAKNAKVYVAARSESKAQDAIASIKKAVPASTGTLNFLKLDLADLSTIPASAKEFLSKESELHVLVNNAGVMNPPKGSKTAQGYELQLGVNNVGTFMFTRLLTPALARTAKTSPAGTVRVVWVSSSAAEGLSVKNGIQLDNLDYHKEAGQMTKYGISKAGNYYHATEFAKRHAQDGIISSPVNPGNLDSELYRDLPGLIRGFLRLFVLHPPIMGAYAELFAGWAPAVTPQDSGRWIYPWGRFETIRQDLEIGSKSKSEGGSGIAEDFWAWTEQQIQPYMPKE
ncbi:hypothetical protein BX600DRAFT_506253 [Xylariales sp. PMI_506]|nr:hypothetical protein BX600DRAFT_506253 [Xylariales sp. PMI_506]